MMRRHETISDSLLEQKNSNAIAKNQYKPLELVIAIEEFLLLSIIRL